jgi:hypothetical protein
VGVNVALTPDEQKAYARVGIDRRINAMARKRKGAHGFNRDFEGWQIDVEGALCEGAAAKALGLAYVPTDDALDTLLGDIGPGLQVRGTKYPSGSLLIHDKDPDDDIYILVTGIDGNYVLRGWIQAKHGKQPNFWRVYKGRGSYWVGQQFLQPMSKLPR